MTKEVLVKISGLQFMPESDAEPIELITTGNYYQRNGKHYVIFEEVMEGFSETTKNTMKIGDGCLDITKKGVTNVHMMFEEKRKNMTYYYTPFGSILIGIEARKVTVQEDGQNIDVHVDYGLEVNYEYVADCKIEVHIQSKEAGVLHI